MREEECGMFQFCHEDNIATTPYSTLASGKLAKQPGEISKRLQEDAFLHLKYDAAVVQDVKVIERIVDLADKTGVDTRGEGNSQWNKN